MKQNRFSKCPLHKFYQVCKALGYTIYPKYWDWQALANSVDPDRTPQTQQFLTHQRVVKWICSNFRIGMARSWSVRILRLNTVATSRIVSRPYREVIKHFSCSTQLSMEFVLLINLKLLIFENSSLLNIAEYENFSAGKYENANYCWHFHIY